MCETVNERRDIMKLAKRTLFFLAAATAILLVTEANFGRSVQARTLVQNSTTEASDTTQGKIARAMSAGPDDIARSARIIDTDAEGNTVVLRDGSNGFTCMPGNPKVIGEPPMCVDAASLQWFADAKAHKPKPTNTVPVSRTCSPALRISQPAPTSCGQARPMPICM